MIKNIVSTYIMFYIITAIGQTQNLNLMPWPQEISTGNAQLSINSNFTIAVNPEITKRIEVSATKFLRRLSDRTGVFFNEGFPFHKTELENATLEIFFDRNGKLEINEDESYQLIVTENKITIVAATDIGVIYGLETLLQLLTNNENLYYFPETNIKDFPRFTWRGLMIDVARHFQPLNVLKRNLDAMAAVKMNVFHWHLSDDQGFRVESKTHPRLHELGSDGLYYTQHQIKEVVQYASDRGIRVIPEIDVPGHATAILTAYPEIGSKDTTYTIERFSGIFNPTLDPTNEKTYEILDDLFGEMAQLFPNKYFHIGGDENEGKHWDQNKKIEDFKKNNALKNNRDLQTYFNIRLEKILAKYGKSVMGWEEIMTNNMPKTALIHSWKGVNEGVTPRGSLETAAKKGYYTVLSNGYYLDLMQPVREHYLMDPLPKNSLLTAIEKARILGGEATMWSELVTPLTIDSRLWPRAAAIAERFWSSENIKNINSLYKRLSHVSFRLEELGITHLKNKDVILRNIANNNNIEALTRLTKAYEPVKIYSRNANGTEYKTYSPFTLFADACTADASDALIFSRVTAQYLSSNTSNKDNLKKELITLLKIWIENDQKFSQIERSPIINNLAPLSGNLSAISKSIISILVSEKIKPSQYKLLKYQYFEIKKPLLDVEFAALNSFKLILEHFSRKNKLKFDLSQNLNLESGQMHQ